MNKCTAFACCLMAAATMTFAAPPNFGDSKIYSHIEKHLPLAQKHSLATGIPVSIMLGMNLHETNYGQSELYLKAFNCFGIKASRWNGPVYHRKDDDRDANGKLIESKFRKYASIEESYADLPKFLKSNSRYDYLFTLPSNSYMAWANGLQMTGYATDSLYAERLIETIEKYELYRFDAPSKPIETNKTLVRPTTANNIPPETSAPAPKVSQRPTTLLEAATKLRADRPTKNIAQPTQAAAMPIQPLETFEEGQAPACPWPTQRLEVMRAQPVFQPAEPRKN